MSKWHGIQQTQVLNCHLHHPHGKRGTHQLIRYIRGLGWHKGQRQRDGLEPCHPVIQLEALQRYGQVCRYTTLVHAQSIHGIEASKQTCQGGSVLHGMTIGLTLTCPCISWDGQSRENTTNLAYRPRHGLSQAASLTPTHAKALELPQ